MRKSGPKHANIPIIGSVKRQLASIGCTLLVVLTSCASGSAALTPTPSPTATQAASPSPSGGTTAVPQRIPTNFDTYPLDAGRWLIESPTYTTVPFSFTLPGGWMAENYGRTISKSPGAPHELSWNVFIIDRLFADSCGSDETQIDVGPSVDDLVTALLAQPGAAISAPVDIELDGFSGKQLELTVPQDLDVATCRIEVGLQLWLDRGGKHQVLLPDGTLTVYIVDMAGDRFVVATQSREASTPGDIAEMESIIGSIEFER